MIRPAQPLPVTVLTGARRTGKTTLAKALGPSRAYVTLDDVGVLDQAAPYPATLLVRRPVTLDEMQRTPDLWSAVERAVDEQRQAADSLLTGSANLLLMEQVADTLAGRAIYLELPRFCPIEWLRRRESLAPLDRLFDADFDLRDSPEAAGDWPGWLLRGGFPPALAIQDHTKRGLWFAAYQQTHLERDLRQLSAVSSLPLAGIKSPEDAAACSDAGFGLEEARFQTFQAWRALGPLRSKVHFWRDRPGRGVDFIIERERKPVAFEVKAGSAVTREDASGRRAFRASLRRRSVLARSVVLHAGRARPLRDGVEALPWGWMVPAT